MIAKYNSIILVLACMAMGTTSCKKYLETKSNQSLSTPSTLKDLQAMLDNPNFLNRGNVVAQTSSDEFYIPFINWQSLVEIRKFGYVWDANLDNGTDWQQLYQNVFYANTVLTALEDIIDGQMHAQSDAIKGTALFLRAHAFYQIAQIYVPQYDQASEALDLGIPLRLDNNFNTPSSRTTLHQTYDQIEKDLIEAIALLPVTSAAKTRPNRIAGYALLARLYLQIGKYEDAKQAADNCLNGYNDLIDYNDPAELAPANLAAPIVKKGIAHREVIFYQFDESSLIAFSSVARIDTTLYRSYEANDIRKEAFFRPITSGFATEDPLDKKIYRFKGSYSHTGQFVGLSTPEVYLIRAEAYARLGNTALALQDLNSLLIKRYKTGTFVPITASSAEEALQKILKERVKEMLFRGVRWSDLKRLNKIANTAVTVTRVLNGQAYILMPNDPRYALLIPRSIMELSNLKQNPR